MRARPEASIPNERGLFTCDNCGDDEHTSAYGAATCCDDRYSDREDARR